MRSSTPANCASDSEDRYSGLGHLAIQIAKAMGFRVIALSSGPTKEQLARDLGAHEYIDGSKFDQAEALRTFGGAKVIMCTAPNSEAAQKLIPGLAVDGTLLLLSLEGQPMTISPGVFIGAPLRYTHPNRPVLQCICWGSACQSEDGLSDTRRIAGTASRLRAHMT